MSSGSINPLLLVRRVVVLTAVALVMFVGVRLSFVQGITRRVTIDGPSMAPQLCGARFELTCEDCRFRFSCDAENLPTDNLAACPNCGFTENPLDAAQLVGAERVLIDRWPLIWSAPKRGAVVALAVPGSDELAVKRIAGLPGERLAIRGGDLFADDRMIRKTWGEIQELRQLVHDEAYQPLRSPDLPARWRSAVEPTRWRATATGFLAAPTGDAENIDWLQYVNWKCTADARSRGITSPIADNDSYNQGETHRPLNAVTDVLLSCRVRVTGRGHILLAASAGNQRFELSIEPAKRVVLCEGDRVLESQRLRADLSQHRAQLDFGLCDRQIFLALDGRTIVRHDYEPAADADTEPTHALAIGVVGAGCEVVEPRIWRDIYYLDPGSLSRRWELPARLGPDEFAVLGDNQPVSIDSRHWQPPAVARSGILGHVYRPFWIAGVKGNFSARE